MAGKSSFTEQEWSDLLRAPLMAGLAVSAASPSGLIGALQEASALSKILADAKKASGGNPIVDGIVADLMTKEGREQAKPSGIFGKGAGEIRADALDTLRRAVSAVDRKSPAEASALKGWLSAVAREVAEASKEGGFLGMGGVQVSEAEADTLRDLDAILGTTTKV
jgi:hypothetical protein